MKAKDGAVDSSYVTWRKQANWNPLTVSRAKGVNFYDENGKEYLDFSSQLMCVNLGHGNENVIKGIYEQLKTLPYVAPGFMTASRKKLSGLLKEILPENQAKFFYATSGTEANEAAVKITRMVKSIEGKTKIMSMYNSYHGSTEASIGLTGDFRRIAVDAHERAPGIVHVPQPYCYRCPFGLKYPSCGLACAEYLDYVAKNEGNVGALILEPVTGTNGVIVPPDEYLPRIREICDENGMFLIADEVMTGWGRTGKWFAVNNWNVQPDILTTAKGLTSAYFPFSLTSTTGDIADYFEDHFFAHGHTYEAHPLGMAAAVSTIEEYKRLNLIERANNMGKRLKNRLEEIMNRHRSVGDVRSIGLFGAIELVKSRETRTPFNTFREKSAGKPLLVDAVSRYCLEKGVYVSSWISHLIIAPPLIISEEELDHGLSVIDDALIIADKESE
ncbi:MAG: aspartate aminotransferase family protein [Candidatus Thermoplasmatota archaeon]|nr:aspartate aminotransferase family protein [Candidatus Thermoplasmatota archaeon]